MISYLLCFQKERTILLHMNLHLLSSRYNSILRLCGDILRHYFYANAMHLSGSWFSLLRVLFRLLDSHIYLTCQFIDHKSRVVWLLRNGNHNLPDSFVYLLIPGERILLYTSDIGSLYLLKTSIWRYKLTSVFDVLGLFSNHGPLYFVSTKRFFSKMGLACHIAKIHSEVLFQFVLPCGLKGSCHSIQFYIGSATSIGCGCVQD